MSVNKYGLLLVLLALPLSSACGRRSVAPPLPAVDETETFATGLDSWTPRAMDTTMPDSSEIAWSIAPSVELGNGDMAAAKVMVDNRTDAAKVWLEKEYDLAPGTTYAVRLMFDMASMDGAINAWRII